MATWEFHQSRSKAIDLHSRVAVDAGDNAKRFARECRASRENEVAANIHEGTAAGFEMIADVSGVCVEVAEKARDRSRFADAALGDEFAQTEPLGVGLHHESFTDLHAGAGLHFQERFSFGDGQADRLFTEHVLSSFGRFDRPRHMELIRQRVVNRIDLRICEKFVIGPVSSRNAERGCGRLGACEITRGDRIDARKLPQLHGRQNFLDANIGSTQDSPTNDFAHVGNDNNLGSRVWSGFD